MVSIALKVEAMPGCDVGEAARQASQLADKLNVMVMFDFNGTPCFVYPMEGWEACSRRWWDRVPR